MKKIPQKKTKLIVDEINNKNKKNHNDTMFIKQIGKEDETQNYGEIFKKITINSINQTKIEEDKISNIKKIPTTLSNGKSKQESKSK